MQQALSLSALVLLPMASALLVWTFPGKERSGARGFALCAMLLELVLAGAMAASLDWHSGTPQALQTLPWIPAIGVHWALGIDGIAMLMVLLTAALAPIALLASYGDIHSKSRDFAACLLLLEGALIGGLTARDLFLFYTFWEAMLLPSYFLIGIWGGEHSPRATTRFFLYTMSASMLMLVAIVACACVGHIGERPSFLLSDLQQQLGQTDLGIGEGALFLAFALAFLVKVPLAPLHGWLPETYGEAPASSLPLLSGVMVKLGAVAFLRFGLLLFPRAATFCLPTIMALCVAGCLYAAWLAAGQSRLRRVFAYSSMSHMALCVLAMTAMTPLSVTGSVVQLFNHGITVSALFLLTGMIERRCKTDHLSELGAIANEAPMLATALVVSAFAMIGLPGLSGFVGEFMLLCGTYQSDGLGVAITEGAFAQGGIVALLTFGALAFLRVAYLLYWLDEPTWRTPVGYALRVTGGLLTLVMIGTLVMLPIGEAPGGLLMRLLAPLASSDNPMAVPAKLSVVVVIPSVVLAAIYMLRVLERTLFGPPAPHRPRVTDLDLRERVVLLPLLVAMVTFGVWPAPLVRMCEPTATAMARYFREGAGWPAMPPATAGGPGAGVTPVPSAEGLPTVSGQGAAARSNESKAP